MLEVESPMGRISLGLVLLVAVIGFPAASADHNADVHSDNMRLVANWNDGGAYRQGSDLAFWGNRAVVGNYGNPGGFWLLGRTPLRLYDPAATEPIAISFRVRATRIEISPRFRASAVEGRSWRRRP